jgi:hypothetical protein
MLSSFDSNPFANRHHFIHWRVPTNRPASTLLSEFDIMGLFVKDSCRDISSYSLTLVVCKFKATTLAILAVYEKREQDGGGSSRFSNVRFMGDNFQQAWWPLVAAYNVG